MQITDAETQHAASSEESIRLHYLDWLQVLAILGVFLFHTVHPFDDLFGWHIKNAESSIVVNVFIGFFGLWGMPFFFLMAGATSWLSLRRRSPGRYIRERVTRLLIPFIVGSLVLTPIQAYIELTHKGIWHHGSFFDFIRSTEARTYFYTEFKPIVFSPEIFGMGYHLWFVAALFAFALLALPLFLWLKQDEGRRFVTMLARLVERRGGLLMFVIPLVLVRFVLQPGSGAWADFFFYLLFFISGYILIADEQFMQAIHRDRLLHLILAIACALFFFFEAVCVSTFDWLELTGTPEFYVSWTVFGINSWCWTMVMIYIGMRFLNFSNEQLRYGREASYPFFWLHQPVILFIAFYTVQWEIHLVVKLLVVVVASFIGVFGLYELFIRRINPVRALFGMKQRAT